MYIDGRPPNRSKKADMGAKGGQTNFARFLNKAAKRQQKKCGKGAAKGKQS